ncbi:hypothetical protein ACTMUQ_04650 [Streptomyces sp. SD11]|uniref:hypothetical protein n=1 Tax=Streptomyces sp. SD11 TaxID=3452209 RepID=UPI003F8B11F4
MRGRKRERGGERGRRRRTVLGTVAATAAALVLAWTPGAQAAPAPVRAAEAPAPETSCTLGGGEWTRCLDIEAELDRAPAVGGDATLTVGLRASAALDDVKLKVELPATLAWRKAPTGFTQDRRNSARPEAYGAVNAAERTLDVEAGQRLSFTGTVNALRAASASIRVQAVSPEGAPFSSEPVIVPLTVGKKSFLGYGKGPFGTAEVPEGAVPAKDTGPFEPVGKEGLPTPHSDDEKRPGIQATSCVRGSWTYLIGNTFHPSQNFEVQVWDEDGTFDDLLAVGTTDANGAYNLCFDNDDGLFGGGQDVYLKFVAFTVHYSVRDADDDVYEFQFETRNNIADGATLDYGRRLPSNPDQFRALRTFEYADNATVWTPGRCWDRDDTDCRHIGIVWPTERNTTAQYLWDDDRVHLVDSAAESPWVVAHEIGHGVMDDVYHDDPPPIDDACGEHFVSRAESRECAWIEGFADFYGSMVVDLFNNPDPFGGFDAPTWGTTEADGRLWDTGPNVEGRVAGALRDLIDDDNEQPWDTYGEGEANVWETFLDHRSEYFEQYWQQRGTDGFNVGDAAQSSLFQNTIDLAPGFREPLAVGAERVRPTPNPPGRHNYRYDTAFRFWSVVALRPGANDDYELELYDDRAMTQRLGQSLSGRGATDFVAVDSNVNNRELGDYYPRVTHNFGADPYVIEVADGGKLLPLTGDQRTMGANDLVEVWDTCTDAKRSITVTPSGATQDAELYVVASRPGPDTSVIGRQQILAGSVSGGAGAPESVEFTPPAGLDCFGVILINKSGSGTYSLSVS